MVENFSECYHCPSVHPELTTVLPEFKRGQGTLHQAGYGAAYGEGIGGFTFDGRPGLPPLPGLCGGGRPPLLRAGVHAERVPQPRRRPRHPALARAARARPHADRVPVAVRPGDDRRRLRHRAARSSCSTAPTCRTSRSASSASSGWPAGRSRTAATSCRARCSCGTSTSCARRSATADRAHELRACDRRDLRPHARGDRGAPGDDRPAPAGTRRPDPPGRAGRAGSACHGARCARRSACSRRRGSSRTSSSAATSSRG